MQAYPLDLEAEWSYLCAPVCVKGGCQQLPTVNELLLWLILVWLKKL